MNWLLGFTVFLYPYLCVFPVTTEETNASAADRRKCPYFQQSGCLLMVIENICEIAEDEVEYSDLRIGRFCNRCCCPRPFESCTEEQKDANCKALFAEYVKDNDAIVGRKTKVLSNLNNIRTKLLGSQTECKKHLAANAVQCGADALPFKDKQHQCELLLWEWEELAYKVKKDIKEFGCSYDSAYRKKPKDVKKRGRPDKYEEDNESTKPQLYQVSSYSDRRQCKYWQQSGCFLDVMEKSCEAGNHLAGLLTGDENVHLCCCPTPYKACKRSEADTKCLETIAKHFPKSIFNTITKVSMLNGLQLVRKELFDLDLNCQDKLAPIEPLAVCSKHPKPFSRHDLKCEMLLWQWEELGDGDKDEFEQVNCPFVVNDKSKDVEIRKGAADFLPADSKIEL